MLYLTVIVKYVTSSVIAVTWVDSVWTCYFEDNSSTCNV